jgi:hypothetical protein
MNLASRIVARFASSVGVGFQWNSPKGTREIVTQQVHPRTGKSIYGVSTAGLRFLELIEVSEIDAEIRRDEKNYEGHLRTQQRLEEEEKAKAEQESWLGFTDQIRLPTAKRRAIDALNKQIGVKGKFASRGQHMINLVKAGYTLGRVTGQRALMSPEGSFFFEKDLSKTGLDFAQYLIDNHVV